MSLESNRIIKHKTGYFLKSIARIIFGLIWLIDAFFKFQPDFVQNLPALIKAGAASQPSFLSGWYSFWINITSAAPVFFALLIGLTEFSIAISLIFGFMRKIGYSVGILTSLVIWMVPEGFGGPYVASAIPTDIGTGIIYAMVFILFIVINDLEGPSKYSIDFYIEQKYHFWKYLAEFS